MLEKQLPPAERERERERAGFTCVRLLSHCWRNTAKGHRCRLGPRRRHSVVISAKAARSHPRQ